MDRLVLVGGSVQARRALAAHFLDIFGDLALLRLQTLADILEAQGVPQLERSQSIGVTPAHRPVDLEDLVGDFGHPFGGIEEQVAIQLPQERPDAVVSGHQRPQAQRQILDIFCRLRRGQLYLHCGMVFKGLQVDGVDLFFLADTLVVALPCLFAQPTALRHFDVKFGHQETVAPGIVRHGVIQIRSDVGPDIQAHNIEQAEASAVRQADERAGDQVGFLHRVLAFDDDLLHCRAEEAADAVGDEVRRVLARHDTLAQTLIAEVRDELEHFLRGIRQRNQLHQVHVARGIEKMRSQEVLPEAGRKSLRDLNQGNAAGVGRDDRVRLPQLLDLAP